MPYNPSHTEDLAAAVARVYGAAETQVLAYIAKQLGRGLDKPQWAHDKADAAGAVRREAERLLSSAHSKAARETRKAIRQAAKQGRDDAAADVAAAKTLSARAARNRALNNDALDALAADAARRVPLPDTHAVLRGVRDAYRRITEEVAAGTLAGVDTRRAAAQRALNKAAGRGITRFKDNAGRSWEMESYAEMALRTATARAALDGHTKSLSELGEDLVYVSDVGGECHLCRPWEGTVLSLSGDNDGDVEVPSGKRDGTVTVSVDGSLDDARDAGLFHANCRHSTSLYVPDVTDLPTGTADPKGDVDRQHLRYLERQTRNWKKRQAAAIDSTAERKAKRRVAEYQSRIRAHTDATGAKRQRQREQVGRAR